MKQRRQNGIGGAQVAEEVSLPVGVNTIRCTPNEAAPFVPAKRTPRPLWRENGRLVFIGAGIVLVLLLLAFNGISHRPFPAPKNFSRLRQQQALNGESSPAAESVTPILETGRPPTEPTDSSRVNPDQIGETSGKLLKPNPGTTLGDIKPFYGSGWQPAPYQPGTQPDLADGDTAKPNEAAKVRSQEDALDKSSLAFVKSNNGSPAASLKAGVGPGIELGLGLTPGTRLRARVESAVNTAVRTPVVAIIEYDYEENGEIAVPAGAKAFGHLESADRSGYMGIHFDSLLMPDGSSIPLDAAATDLQLRPLRGKVEGRHSGKNIVGRSFAGVGEITAALVGRGSLNQPLSEGDLLRERVASNIGEASDQNLTNVAVTERIVVSLPADTEIYIILQNGVHTGGNPTAQSTMPAIKANVEELQQLMRLQQELNQAPETKQASQ